MSYSSPRSLCSAAISAQCEKPAIIVPVMEEQDDDALAQVATIVLQHKEVNVIELRIDRLHFALDTGKVVRFVKQAITTAGELPVIVTFRTLKEGGCTDISPEDYVALNQAILEQAVPTYIDVEFNLGIEVVEAVIATARVEGVSVIISSHDFTRTDPEDQLIERLEALHASQADIIKMAVMPIKPRDVFALMSATVTMRERYPALPIITMSMGKTGVLSRISGEFFGSNATFGTVGNASAPGQVAVDDLYGVLTTLHQLNQPDK